MVLTDKFYCGRFRLESLYVNFFSNYISDITINDMSFVVTKEGAAREIYNKFLSGEKMEVKRIHVTRKTEIYFLIKLEDKEWVYIERI